MSYTPTEWKTGDVITADKLNNMENGVVNAGLFIINGSGWDPSHNASHEIITIDKTYNEIVAAYTSGKRLVIYMAAANFGTFAFNLSSIRNHEEVVSFVFNGDYLDFSDAEEYGVLCNVATITIVSQGAIITSKQVAWK